MGTLHYAEELKDTKGKIIGRSMAAGGAEKDRIVLPIDIQNTVCAGVDVFEKQGGKTKLEMTLKTDRTVRADPTSTNKTNIKMKHTGNVLRDKTTQKVSQTYTPAGN